MDVNLAIQARKDYLDSFNKVIFIDDNTIVVDQKFKIKKVEHFSAQLYTISNLNAYWKVAMTFEMSFDHADLESITDNTTYNARIVEFSLWMNDLNCGKLSLKLGYDGHEHEVSERVAEFFGQKINPSMIKKEKRDK